MFLERVQRFKNCKLQDHLSIQNWNLSCSADYVVNRNVKNKIKKIHAFLLKIRLKTQFVIIKKNVCCYFFGRWLTIHFIDLVLNNNKPQSALSVKLF